MRYFAGEKIILESDNKALVLTSHRVRYATGSGILRAPHGLTSILLEEVASCSIRQISYTLLLLLAWVSLVLIFVGEVFVVVGLALAILFTGGFFLSQRRVLAIASAGDTIYVNTSGMDAARLRELVDEIEIAKAARLRGVLPSG